MSLVTYRDYLVRLDILILEANGLVTPYKINPVGRTQITNTNSTTDNFHFGMTFADSGVVEVDMSFPADYKCPPVEWIQYCTCTTVHIDF